MTPTERRAFLLHYARVVLADARYRIRNRPAQRDLFGALQETAA